MPIGWLDYAEMENKPNLERCVDDLGQLTASLIYHSEQNTNFILWRSMIFVDVLNVTIPQY
jgi:hypothetical protein